MQTQLLEKFETVEVDASDLGQPLSLATDGSVATLEALIEDRAPSTVREALGVSILPEIHRTVRPVAQLNDGELKKLAIAVLATEPDNVRLAVVGHGSFSREALEREIEEGTFVGQRFISAVKQHAMFLEAAVAQGKLRRKRPVSKLTFPELD